MFIGVMFQEYVNNARVLKNIPIAPIVFINNFKSKKEEEWKFIGEIKGRIANKMLFKNIDEGDEYHFDDFISIIKWLKATTCFKEEVLRLENWKEFFNIKSERYVKKVIELAIDISLDLNDIGKKYLEDYVNSLQKTSLENLDLNNDKEKYICIPKGRIQYFFNIISAEIINQIYRERYLKASEKVLIASSSMRDNKKNCCSLKTNNGFKCKNCSNDCYVSKLGVLGEEMGVRIYSVESDSPIFEIREKCKTETAIIAATSGLKLMSIGWKIVRTGYIPQCVLLENCKNSVLKTKRNVIKT